MGLPPREDLSRTFMMLNDVDLCSQGQIYRIYDTALWLGHSFLSFDIVKLCLAHECIFITSVKSWPLTSISKYMYIFTMNLSLARSSLLFDIGIPNFGIWVNHHVVYIFDLCMTLTCDLYLGSAGGGVLVRFTNSFYLVWTVKKCYITWNFLLNIEKERETLFLQICLILNWTCTILKYRYKLHKDW